MNDILPAPDAGKTFQEIKYTDPTVYSMIRAGKTLEEIVVTLVGQREAYLALALRYKAISPVKRVLPDGSVVVWRCPDELIPVETL